VALETAAGDDSREGLFFELAAVAEGDFLRPVAGVDAARRTMDTRRVALAAPPRRLTAAIGFLTLDERFGFAIFAEDRLRVVAARLETAALALGGFLAVTGPRRADLPAPSLAVFLLTDFFFVTIVFEAMETPKVQRYDATLKPELTINPLQKIGRARTRFYTVGQIPRP
jgi:hypothetical protein